MSWKCFGILSSFLLAIMWNSPREVAKREKARDSVVVSGLTPEIKIARKVKSKKKLKITIILTTHFRTKVLAYHHKKWLI